MFPSAVAGADSTGSGGLRTPQLCADAGFAGASNVLLDLSELPLAETLCFLNPKP